MDQTQKLSIGDEFYRTQNADRTKIESSLETCVINELGTVDHEKYFNQPVPHRRVISALTKRVDSAAKTRPSTARVPLPRRFPNKEKQYEVDLKHSVIMSKKSQRKPRPKTGVNYISLMVLES